MTRLLALLLLLLAWPALADDATGLAGDPFLVVEPGMHTAIIKRLDADAAGRFLVTGSDDKTVRVWSAEDGRLLRTIRLPAGPGNVGKAYVVAISPDGAVVAAGGWTGKASGEHNIYLFDRATGRMLLRIGGLANVVLHLAFSPDGGRLIATLAGANGVRLLDPATGRVVAEDRDYGDDSYGAAFDGAGRIATTSFDGEVRLYDRDLKRLARLPAPGGKHPYGVAFSPDGSRLAVGYDDTKRVDVLDGRTLAPLIQPDTRGVDYGNLSKVAWSADGRFLLAGGTWPTNDRSRIRRWAEGGRGAFTDWPLSDSTLMTLRPLPDGRLAFAAADPRLGLVDGAGRTLWQQAPPLADLRAQQAVLGVTADGRTLRFGYEPFGRDPILFSLAQGRLGVAAAGLDLATARTSAPGIDVQGWQDTTTPTLDGRPLALEPYETSRSLAIAADGQSFVLGADWWLRAYRRDGTPLWQRPVPGVVWAVTVTADARLAVAAYGDGTIRWHRMSDGEELLAFYPHADRERWVAWTPAGYYMASAGGEDLIGWQVNQGFDEAPEFYTASRFAAQYNRPDVIDRVLDTLDVGKAVASADAARGIATQAKDIRVALPPRVAIDAPIDGEPVAGEEVELTYTVKGDPGSLVDRVRVRVNDIVVVDVPKFRLDADGAQTRRVKAPLDGTDPIVSVVAEAGAGKSEEVAIRLKRQETQPTTGSRKPTLWVLAIGIKSYEKAPRLQLRFADKDAADFVAAMQAQAGSGGRQRIYDHVEVQPLINRDATADAVLDGLEWLERGMQQQDVAVLFVSSHGSNDSSGDFYLLPEDVDVRDDIRLGRTAVSFYEVKKRLGKLAERGQTLVFLDACYSGNVLQSKAGPLDMDRVVNDLIRDQKGMVVFSSSTGTQLSGEDADSGHGYFTAALLEGLSGKADGDKDGFLHVSELETWVKDRVKAMTNGAQTPTVTYPGAVSINPRIFVSR